MDILADLRTKICEVTFTKKNGEERTMICTLLPHFLPVQGEFGEATLTRYNEKAIENDYVTVWDLESDDWRAFKPSTITHIEFSEE